MNKQEVLERMQDTRVRMGGERGPRRKLGALQAEDILRDTESTAQELADFYEVSPSLINNIRSRKASYFEDPYHPGTPADIAFLPLVSYHKPRKRHHLSDEQVLEIKLTQTPIRELAKKFGVSYHTVRMVRLNDYEAPEEYSGDACVGKFGGKTYYVSDLRRMAVNQNYDPDRIVINMDGRFYTQAECDAIEAKHNLEYKDKPFKLRLPVTKNNPQKYPK